jgi:hypothetical protein
MGNPKNKPKPKTDTKEADKTVKDASKAKPKEEAPKKAK